MIIAGQAGVAGHLRIGRGARVAGGAGVTKNVPAGEEWYGFPAGPSRQKLRTLASLERAGAEFKDMTRRAGQLERALERLSGDHVGEPAGEGEDPAGDRS